MKRYISVLLCLALMLSLAGCGNSGSASGKTGSQSAGVSDVLEQGVAAADGGSQSGGTEPGDPAPAESAGAESSGSSVSPEAPEEGIDVDLTVLSSTMVYSEVYNMLVSPADYIGKTVKMAGLFTFLSDESTGNIYFACIIQDATACCAQGIEFVLTDDYTYSDDYPEVNEEICVIGTFDTYREGEYTYCTLRNAVLV